MKGLAQCSELCWQLRGIADKRQVKGAKLALQHNIGLGGAVVVGLYRMGFPDSRRTMVTMATSAASSPAGFQSAPIFDRISEHLKAEGANIVKKVKGVYAFKVTGGPSGNEGTWLVDVKNDNGSVAFGSDAKADVTITISDADFLNLATGKLNPQTAFFQKKLKMAGNMGLAMKLKDVLPPPGQQPAAAPSAGGSSNEGFKSSGVFKEIETKLKQDGASIVKKVGGVYAFKVTGGPSGKEGTWVVDVKNGMGSVKAGPADKVDCTITISDEDLLKLSSGKLNPQTAFFQKKLKLSGNMGLAMKLKDVLPTPGQAKL